MLELHLAALGATVISTTAAAASGALAANGGSGSLIFLIATILVGLTFDFTNGFHDTANAVATSISTRVLSPRFAIGMAALLNFLGAAVSLFFGAQVAKTIGTDVAAQTALTEVAVMAALLAAISWNLLTWYYGLPSSSSHALIGGLIGAAVVQSAAHFSALKMAGIVKIVLSLILSPVVGLIVAYLVSAVVHWSFRNTTPRRATDVSSWMQRVSAAFVAFSHGSNDAQKTMAVIAAAVISYEGRSVNTQFHVDWWIIVICATAMALGTSFGGWRIIQTMGMRIVKLRPIDGFSAEATSAAVIVTASQFGLPVSTTHVIAGSVMGVGARHRMGAVRWGVAGDMVVAWVLTGPITAVISAVLCALLLTLGVR
ncbi:MAG TPA: anion permease [Ktedonobacterales bacterium]